MYDILAMGEAVIDLTYTGHSSDGNALYERQPGGAPSNMLTAAAKFGAKTALMGMVGNDSFGAFLKNSVSEQGIDVQCLTSSDHYPTFIALVDLDETGDRSFFRIQSTSALEQFSADHVNYNKIDECRILHIAGSMLTMEKPLNAIKRVIAYVKDKDILLSCDVNWRSVLCSEEYVRTVMLPYILQFDIVKLSEEELCLVAGTMDISQGCEKLLQAGIKLVAVSMGKYGCFYAYSGGQEHLYTYDTDVIDTNAAGDTFTGVLLAKLCESGLPIDKIPQRQMRDIFDLANCAGAVCAAKRGAIRAIPTKEEVAYCKKNTPMLFCERSM